MKNKVEEFIRQPRKSLFKLAAPIVIAMLVQTMYHFIDTAFVGRLGAEAIAALTFSYPLFFILLAINVGIATGMSSRISRYLGEKNRAAAENIAIHGLFISLGAAVVLFILGLLLLEPIFGILGAEGTVLKLAMDYMSIILVGIFFMFPSFILNSVFSAQGDTKTPMMIMVTALLFNIILDPIFIYWLGFGVRGAAIATVCAFLLSLTIFIHFVRRSYLRISLRHFKYSFHLVKDIFKVGLPASFTMLLISVYLIFINRFMAHFGTKYVAASGLALRLESVSTMPVVAFSLATMTMVGMFFGAKRYDLMRMIAWYALKVGVLFSSVMGLLLFVFPSIFFRIFTSDPELLTIGVPYLRIDVLTYPLMAVVLITTRTMQGMGKGIPGLVMNFVRVLVVAVPLAYVFVFVLGLGYLSVAAAMVTSAVVSSAVALIWLRSKLKIGDGD